MISGLGYYRAWLGGVPLDDHELGESMQFQQQLPYDAVDCTQHVADLLAIATSSATRPGADDGPASATSFVFILAVELGRGWYGEQMITALGNRPSGPRMLRCLLTLTLADGTRQYLSSQPKTWRRGEGPVVWEELHLGIVYDARRETSGWQLSSFDDGAWTRPRLINLTDVSSLLGAANMTTSIHPRIRKVGAVIPKLIRAVATDTWLVDVGQVNLALCDMMTHCSRF